MLISTFTDQIAFREPLSIAGRTLVGQQVLRITANYRGWIAEAEAAGVFYRGETGTGMQRQVQEWLSEPPNDLAGMRRAVDAMPAGGARNALDWIVWQLDAAERGVPIYRLAHLARLRPRTTMVTLGVAPAARMAEMALGFPLARVLKLKLDGSPEDAERVVAVRRARPDVKLSVDANEGWTIDHLEQLMGLLLQNGVQMVEQPLPASADTVLEGFDSPIPLAADESLQTLDDLETVARRYQIANIKLDKCGGLSYALQLAAAARRKGMQVMIGCMGGRSMALLPAFIAAQEATFVDLDAPLLMASDSRPAASYEGGRIAFPEAAYAPARASGAEIRVVATGGRHASA